MIRIVLALLITVLLQACASAPEPRPKVLLDAEQNMQRGTAAYRNDEYNVAANAYTRALDLYQSIDDSHGIFEASVNLIQTSITIDSLQAARRYLQGLQGPGQPMQADSKTRLTLLEVRLLHAEEKLPEAFEVLQSLWPKFDASNRLVEPNEHSIAIIAATARIAQQLDHPGADQWLERLQQAVSVAGEGGQRYQALLLRLQANSARKQARLQESETLLEQAHAIYREMLHRRGMAVTLQQLADLKRQQNEPELADGLYQRSLKIHLWTLNRKAAKSVLQALVEINRDLGDSAEVELFSAQLKKLGE